MTPHGLATELSADARVEAAGLPSQQRRCRRPSARPARRLAGCCTAAALAVVAAAGVTLLCSGHGLAGFVGGPLGTAVVGRGCSGQLVSGLESRRPVLASGREDGRGSLGVARGRRREGSTIARRAVDAIEGLVGFTTFSVVTGVPIPLVLGGLLARAESLASKRGELPPPVAPAAAAPGGAEEVEPRDLMWAFPSFAVFLERSATAAPPSLPMWARCLCLATFWPGVIWYLYYKLEVEEDLRRSRGLGIGGYVVIVPFSIGLAAGVFGEFAYGALEGGMLDNPFSCAFYAAFAWIYLNQWFLYNKVNQLFEDLCCRSPRQQGRALPRDGFAELFPFVKKPTLSLLELATTPSLWFNLGSLLE